MEPERRLLAAALAADVAQLEKLMEAERQAFQYTITITNSIPVGHNISLG